MTWTRREFVGLGALLGLAGCARVEQSRLGKLAPDWEFRKEGPVRFAALNDLHLRDSRSVGIVGRAVNAINNDGDIDFVAVLGDLSARGTLTEMNLARHALDRLQVPYYCIPGPHDHILDGADSLEFFRRTFKNNQWKMPVGGWTIIGLDTTQGRESAAAMPEANLAWLDGQLSHLDKSRPVALLCHHPLGPNTRGERLANADAVLARFQGYNLRLVASGHYHGNQAEEHEGILFVTTACCSTTADNHDGTAEKGFRIFTLDKAQMQQEFVQVPT